MYNIMVLVPPINMFQLYGTETRIPTRAVKRNLERFPGDFMFSLSFQELRNLGSQFGISSLAGHGGRRYQVMAFTEQGIAMLSSVLNSKMTIKVNIEIIRTFASLRMLLANNSELSRKLAE